MRRDRAVGREQREPELALAAFLDGLDPAEPARRLAVGELPEGEPAPIDRPAFGAPVLLLEAPEAVLLAVLQASMASAVHGGPPLPQSGPHDHGGRSAPDCVPAYAAGVPHSYVMAHDENRRFCGPGAKVGLDIHRYQVRIAGPRFV